MELPLLSSVVIYWSVVKSSAMNTLLKAGESYTYDYKTDIGADYVKGTAKITLIANTASDKNCNVVNYVTLKDIEIDFQ